MAKWIISYFPPHMNYVEPCCGACSVLLQKPRSPLETVNDLDGNVVNFFRMLRDQPGELIRKIRLTPWARAEYELSLEPCEDVVERARRFFVMSWMAVAGQPSGWRRMHDIRARWRAAPRDIQEADLWPLSRRLLDVQLECDDAKTIIADYSNEGSLLYFDPPYPTGTRTNGRQYRYEWTDADHIQGADLLRQCAGHVIVSGYACDLYRDLYEAHGWHRVDKEAQTNSGGKRIESLWLSPRTAEALAMPEQLTMEAL